MRQQLKKITDLTINDILNKNIILPSTYFDKFNYELYGGTPILVINSNELIEHGKNIALAFKNMLVLGKDVVEANLNEKIKTIFH